MVVDDPQDRVGDRKRIGVRAPATERERGAVEDTVSDESASFVVEASSPLIACTRAANRLLGPDVETRPVYACAVCGEDLWDGGAPDSSG